MAVDEDELDAVCEQVEMGGCSLSGSLRFDLTMSPSKSVSKSPNMAQEEEQQEQEEAVVASSGEEVAEMIIGVEM